MLSHDQLIFAIQKLYPDVQHGKDFWAAHEVEIGSDKQLAEANVIAWRSPYAQPDIETLRVLFVQHKAEWEAQENRHKRNALLSDTDWTQTPDLSADFRKRWANYRQALRDLPQQAGFPQRIDWPQPPAD